MKTTTATTEEMSVCRPLAAEDLQCGDFVGILYEIVECPSFMWTGCDPQLLPPDQLVRLLCRSSDGGTPLKVKAISLPFVFVKQPCGQHKTLDVRQHRLVRLNADYAAAVWKVQSKGATVAAV